MPRRGLSLEVRVSPYNTVCVGGDLPRSARSVATALTPGATSTEGTGLGGFRLCRWFRPRSGLLCFLCVRQCPKCSESLQKPRARWLVAPAAWQPERMHSGRPWHYLSLVWPKLCVGTAWSLSLWYRTVGLSFQRPRSENAKKAFEWLAQMASVLSGFRSPARLPGLRWCSGFLRGAG